ncbi:MAG TPA: T6SS immunity protein Tdi1 domain-containing protein [Gemmatimonadales bacterium]|nr:T6SS immunity protein Tdi1 domain-containing protein [Gemmatimonadales bacterium]
MHLTDYLIDQTGVDWAARLTPFYPLVPPEFAVWMVNRFGDVVFVANDGSVHLLDVGGGSGKQLAASRDEFTRTAGDDGVNNCLLIPLVDACVAAGLVLGPGQCYSYRQPPMLGGEYSVANTRIVSLAEHYSFYGEIYRQTKDLPDGQKVRLRVTQ